MLIRRHGLFCFLLLLMALLAPADSVLAQGANKAPVSENAKIVGRNFTVEAIIVTLLIGGAIFAVCRSSRRV